MLPPTRPTKRLAPLSPRALPILCALIAAVCACAGASRSKVAQGVISGTVTYLERGALPPEAQIVVRLEDVSHDFVPGTVLAQTKFTTAGEQVPIPFRLLYESARIVPEHRYELRATILVDGEARFAATVPCSLPASGEAPSIAILVAPVDSGVRLEGTRWVLVELDGAALGADAANSAYLQLKAQEKRLGGSGGCNLLTGGYELGRGTLKFTPIASTRMACPEPVMEQERLFLAALAATREYAIAGDRLELRDGDRVLARFQARP